MERHPQHYGLIYKATNLINGKIYIGKTTRIELYNNKKYRGSGLVFKQAKLKYGIENFKFEILQYIEHQETDLESHRTLNNTETYYIEQFDSIVPKGYNVAEGGEGGNLSKFISEEAKIQRGLKIIKANTGRKHSEEAKLKVSISNKGKILSEETKVKISLANKGRKIGKQTEQVITNRVLKNTGKKRTEETKAKISIALKGKVRSEEHCKKLSISQIGKILSEETKVKISLAGKGRVPKQIQCPHCNKIGASNTMPRWHFDNCKQILI